MKTARSQKRSKTDRIVGQKQNYQRYLVKWPGIAASPRALCELYGANIKACRLERGWKIDDLALKASVHPSYLRQVEQGTRDCSQEIVARIAVALDVPLRELLGSTCELSEKGTLFAQEFLNGDRRLMNALASILRQCSVGTPEAPSPPQAPDDGRRTTPKRDFADLGRDRPKAKKNKAPID